jgi:hypothetical protein
VTTNTGYAVETKDGKLESVYNFATARYLVRQGLAKRVYDTYTRQYIFIKKEDM